VARVQNEDGDATRGAGSEGVAEGFDEVLFLVRAEDGVGFAAGMPFPAAVDHAAQSFTFHEHGVDEAVDFHAHVVRTQTVHVYFRHVATFGGKEVGVDVL